MTRLMTVGLTAALCGLAATVSAHHSHGNYNLTGYITLTGTITEVQWLNPHSWVYIEVKDARGEAEVWALEGASVVQLQRRGWTKGSLKVGSTVGVRCHQLRDGSNGCLLGYITVPGSEEKLFD